MLTIQRGLGFWAALRAEHRCRRAARAASSPSRRSGSSRTTSASSRSAWPSRSRPSSRTASFAGQAIGLPGVAGPTLGGVDLARRVATTTTSSSSRPRSLFALALLDGAHRARPALQGDARRRASPRRTAASRCPLYRMLAFMSSGASTQASPARSTPGLIRYVSPDTFSLAIMFLLLAMVIIGGRDNIYGAALGAALLIYVRQQFRQSSGVSADRLRHAHRRDGRVRTVRPRGARSCDLATRPPGEARAIAVGSYARRGGRRGPRCRCGAPDRRRGRSRERRAEREQDVLTIRGVTKRFKGVVALEDVSIDVGARRHPRHRRPERLGQDDPLQHRHGRLRPDEWKSSSCKGRVSQVGAPTESRGSA